MTTGVYRILLNSDNRGWCYVGSSGVRITDRWGDHRRRLRSGNHHSPALQNAWNKYGEDAFTFEVIEECSKDIQYEREQFWMDNLNSEFNAVPFAGSPRGYKPSPETRAKISAANKGKRLTQEQKDAVSVAQLGRPRPPGERAKIAATKLSKRTDFCSRGHEYTEENADVVVLRTGTISRQCHKCINFLARRQYARTKGWPDPPEPLTDAEEKLFGAPDYRGKDRTKTPAAPVEPSDE